MATEIDVRSTAGAAIERVVDSSAMAGIAEEVSSLLPERHSVHVASFDAESGNPAVVVSRNATPEAGNYVNRALAHVQRIGPVLGLAAEQPAEYMADPHYETTSTGAVAVHLRQQHQGIPIYDASETVRFDADGALLEVAGRSFTVASDAPIVTAVPATDALRVAAEHVASGDDPDTAGRDPFGNSLAEPAIDLGGFDPQPDTVAADRPDRATVFERVAPFEHSVTASLVWFPIAGDMRLGWHLRLDVPGGAQYRFIIDANEPRILLCKRITRSIVGRGQVVLRSGTPRAEVAMPLALSTYGAPIPSGLPNGFPDHWMIDTSTAGATVSAVDATTNQPIAGSLAGGEVVFPTPVNPSGIDQLVLNLFALCGVMHDVLYLLGFREIDGNFQVSSFGRGGRALDAVLAKVHPGAVWGTANMATPPDGTRPLMNMGLVNSTQRHTALDPDVVYHEYTHGLTNRLVGGPMNDTALDAEQSSGMGEGWSDFFACTILGKTTVGDWVVADSVGIRSHAYDESYPNTYADLGHGDFTEVHNIGELWCATLMSLGRRIGPWVAAQIVVDALKLTSANPSFLAARDAILLAAGHFATARGDSAAEQAAFVGEVWNTFARHGMGPAAQTNGATLTGIVADFTSPTPSSPATVSATATPALAIPDANNAGVRSAITLAAPGMVSKVSVTVDITHTYRGDLRVWLIAPNGETAMLHDRIGGGTNDLHETYSSDTAAALAGLLGQPAAGTWTLAVSDNARVDIGRLDSWHIEVGLGEAADSIDLEANPGIVVPDNDTTGVTSVLTVDAGGAIQQAEIDIDITHTYIGDLEVAVRAPSGERVVLHRRKRGGEDNLIATFSSAAGGVLSPLVGLEAHGDWALQVADRAARDVGKLNRWALHLRV